MRAMIRQGISTVGVTIKPAATMIFFLSLFCMTTLIVLRQQCVREGYEISRLSLLMEDRNLRYEKLAKDYYGAMRREALMDKAAEMGFVFPAGGKVFYVQR